jgi:lipopolysaccharide export LptBFGC system permease protein LptF
VVGVAAVIGLGAGELLVPRAKARLDRLQQGDVTPRSQSLGRYYDRHTQWFRGGDLLLYLPSYDPATQSFVDVVGYRLSDGLVSAVIDAERLAYENGGWLLVGAREQRVATSELVEHERVPLALNVGLADLLEITGDPAVMSRRDVRELAARRRRAGFDAAAFEIELHNRIAYPLAALAMFLLAVPWSLNPNRRRSLAVNLGAGVVGVAVLLSLTYVFRLLALSHRLPPALGAWGIHAFCLALAPVSMLLAQRYRTRGTLW